MARCESVFEGLLGEDCSGLDGVLFGIFLTADAVSGFKDKSILTLPVLLNYWV